MTIDGVSIDGLLTAEIQGNNYFSADRFRAQVARSAAPVVATVGPDQRIEFVFGLDNVWQQVLVGQVDTVTLDPIAGVFSLEGRDLSSMLIDTQIAETFANRTSSEIAETLASRHGLTTIVDPTSTASGRYYQSEHDRLSLGQFAKTTTEWDLLSFLATQEGFDLCMEGDTLRFTAPQIGPAVSISSEECLSLRLNHCVSLARPMQISVKSWNSRSAAAISAISSSPGIGTLSSREITRPNLPAAEAQRVADRVMADLKRHEWTAEISMPGDLELTTRSRIDIVGTGTDWDRTYTVSQLTRYLDNRRGFVQHLSLQGAS